MKPDAYHSLLSREAQDALRRAASAEEDREPIDVVKAVEAAEQKARTLNPERYRDGDQAVENKRAQPKNR